MNKMEMVCIVCPMGCRLQISNPEDAPEISGNQCPKGAEYALAELLRPTRVVTSTVVISNAALTRLPVKTAGAIPKALVFPCLEELARVRVRGPVRMGDIIIKDLLQTGIDVVATRSLD
jgi:CxxC motif-containing protein